MEKYGLIMAGGNGTRFWPMSRKGRPKQLLNLSNKLPLICEIFEHLTMIIPRESIFIITNIEHKKLIMETFNYSFPENNIICEPLARNTAACILYSLLKIKHIYGNGSIVIVPSDSYIGNNKLFCRNINDALNYIEQSNDIITLGLKPKFPATGYGYIKYSNSMETIKNILEFKEKPTYETAVEYVKSKEYVWNSGIFISNILSLIENYKNFLPIMYEQLIKINTYIETSDEYHKLKQLYPLLENISIDKGIMEKTSQIKVIMANFIWDDIGSWDKLVVYHKEDRKGNIFVSQHVDIDTENTIVYSKDKMIATLGLKNMVIVEHDGVILVCDKGRLQDIGKITEKLKKENKEKYL
jgi:mannose-1-phosphate guanylyltransferase